MTAVSQALVDFANGWRQPPAPGFEIIETPRYRIVLQPELSRPWSEQRLVGAMRRGGSGRAHR